MAINNILDISRQGMTANRKAMETTSNNISNANTEGYSRQRAQFEAETSAIVGGVRTSRGVRVKENLRVHDVFVQNQILSESRGFGTSVARRDILTRVQDVVSHGDFRMGDVVNNFFNRVRELAANPEQGALRVGVIQAARNTAHSFRDLHESLDTIRRDVDRQLEAKVGEINRLTRDLADLNASISRLSARGSEPHELLDRRDLILRDISQKLGIQAVNDDSNQTTLALEGAGILVSGNRAHELVAVRTEENGNKAAGNVEIFLKDDDGYHNIGKALKEGELAGMFDVRDRVITRSLQHLDKAAYKFAKRINEVHSEGVAADGFFGDEFFRVDAQQDAAAKISVNEKILENPALIAVGYEPEATADNRIALKLADVQNELLLPTAMSGGQTLNDGLNVMIGEIGIFMEEAEHSFDHQKGILQQLDNYRESVSGVNLEEEALNMMQYQTVFNASAKAMKVGSELFQTILDIAE